MEFIKEDIQFLTALGWALLALLLSAIILLALSFVYVAANAPGGAANTYSKTVPGKQLKSRMGTAKAAGEGVEITGFKTHDKKQHALISLKTAFRAENYPFLSYQFEGWHTGMRINFIWRTASNPRGLSTTILNRSLDNPGTINLAKEPNWQGTVTEIGLHIVGESRDEPLIIPELTFQPYGWKSMAAAVWSEWTAFRGWSGTSINVLSGTPGPPGSQTISPTATLAALAGLALFLVFIVRIFRPGIKNVAYVVVIFLPWLILDNLWQLELNTQLEQSRLQFQKKSVHEKHLASEDRDIYLYAKRLKEEVLPGNVARIFILSASSGHNFERLKTQYYLLPHNIYNYGNLPPSEGTFPDDYILTLHPAPDITFSATRGTLIFKDGRELMAELIDTDTLATLYKVTKTRVIPRDKKKAALIND